MTEEKIVYVLASRFSWPGADRDDVEQEARFALERCRPKWRPGGKAWLNFAWLCVTSHLIEVQRRESYRRPQLVSLEDRHPTSEDVVDRVDARQRLRLILEFPLNEKQRHAVDRALVGMTCPRDERCLDTALQRGKTKILAAAS